MFEFAGQEYITRDELMQLVKREGIDMTRRTLEYWHLTDKIPRPLRVEGQGHRAFYPRSFLNILRAMAALRPKAVRKLRQEIASSGGYQTLHFGNKEFEVLPSMLEFEADGHKCTLYKLADGSGDELLLVRRSSGQE